MAGRLGIEPRFTASKAAVLPLDDLPIYSILHIHSHYPLLDCLPILFISDVERAK
ncbi:MAG: hypothetical protein UW78_C0006G0005 [Candidatus Azambacteria bacterium GW2011_GWA1_44_9]|uniref:Uncharacterized protein n=1 Tax=Candidatus Azambacteria bacterium GW2011_GWA1_44_9 TaxID=1618610 RepID=A0A0G1KDL5_9BACT|nr:MAG: hypothetical protein UW78_C0006G0005 [Candidatus Azambacteria bacterium GW2011_GWA1_44_9]